MHEEQLKTLKLLLENLDFRLKTVEFITDKVVTGMNEQNKLLANALPSLSAADRQTFKDAVAKNESHQEKLQIVPADLQKIFEQLFDAL